jgi:hypothetical protein
MEPCLGDHRLDIKPPADYYYWFPADLVVVDATWVDYVP